MAKNNYKNATAMPTNRLREILNDPYTRGVDGQDYGPIRHELEAELWSRAEKEQQSILAQYERAQKLYFKHQATTHKRKGKSA